MSSAGGDPILQTALANVIEARYEGRAYGLVVEGLPQIPIGALAHALGGPGRVYISLIGAADEEELITWARGEGWDELGFGTGATHAVRVRNEAPPEAVKLAFVWREEERLHSLTHRGYEAIGPQQVLREIGRLGAARAANAPEQHLWEALASPALAAYLSLEGVVAYFGGLFADEAEDQLEAPRRLLPVLGFLPDPQLLTGAYASAPAITKRLLTNGAMVRRLQRADEEDRQKAANAVRSGEGDERAQFQAGYSAFLRIAGGELAALQDLSLADAERLFAGKSAAGRGGNADAAATTEDDVADEGGAETEPSPRRRSFPNLAVAAIQLTIEGDGETLSLLIDRALRALEGDEIQDGRLEEGRVAVDFAPDARAVVLTRVATANGRLGGRLDAREQPLDAVLRDLPRHIERFEFFDEVRLHTLEELLRRAEAVVPGFEGAPLLGEYLGRRAALLPFGDLLASSPLACLIAREDIRTAAQQAIAAYERLLSHLERSLGDLRRRSREGAVRLYSDVLALDTVRVRGEDEVAVLLPPVNPLVLWKYVELAVLVLGRGAELAASDRDLLAEDIADLPEPLLAIYAPSDQPNEPVELGYAARLGSLPVYRPISIEAADLSEGTLHLSGTKLAALYPPAKENLHILLVDPLSTHQASRAVKRLVQRNGFRRATLAIARTQRSGDGGLMPPDRTMDELAAEGQVTVEEISAPSTERLADHLARRPVHLLAVAGERRKNVELIESEGTRLHPLSLPHRLHADPLLGTVSLQARSIQPAEGGPQHPFGLYQSLISTLR